MISLWKLASTVGFPDVQDAGRTWSNRSLYMCLTYLVCVFEGLMCYKSTVCNSRAFWWNQSISLLLTAWVFCCCYSAVLFSAFALFSFLLSRVIKCFFQILLQGLVCRRLFPSGIPAVPGSLMMWVSEAWCRPALRQCSALKQMCSQGLSGTFFSCTWVEWAQCLSETECGRQLQKLGIAIRCWNSQPQDAAGAKNLTRFKKELDVCLGIRNRGSCQNKWLPNVLEGDSNLIFLSLCWFPGIRRSYLSSAGSWASDIPIKEY